MTDSPAIVWSISKAPFSSIADTATVCQDSPALFSVDIDDDLHTLFKARNKVFEVVDGQPTNAGLHYIVEELVKLLYPIQFNKEGGEHNLTGLIMDKAD